LFLYPVLSSVISPVNPDSQAKELSETSKFLRDPYRMHLPFAQARLFRQSKSLEQVSPSVSYGLQTFGVILYELANRIALELTYYDAQNIPTLQSVCF
jgi:hypothetical protein